MSLFDATSFTRGRPKKPKTAPAAKPLTIVELGGDWLLARHGDNPPIAHRPKAINRAQASMRTRCDVVVTLVTFELGTKALACDECLQRGGR